MQSSEIVLELLDLALCEMRSMFLWNVENCYLD